MVLWQVIKANYGGNLFWYQSEILSVFVSKITIKMRLWEEFSVLIFLDFT
jgi:hypothetical protein